MTNLETQMLAVEYEVWLKMHNGKPVDADKAPSNEPVATDIEALQLQDGAAEVVHSHDKYKTWAHTKV